MPAPKLTLHSNGLAIYFDCNAAVPAHLLAAVVLALDSLVHAPDGFGEDAVIEIVRAERGSALLEFFVQLGDLAEHATAVAAFGLVIYDRIKRKPGDTLSRSIAQAVVQSGASSVTIYFGDRMEQIDRQDLAAVPLAEEEGPAASLGEALLRATQYPEPLPSLGYLETEDGEPITTEAGDPIFVEEPFNPQSYPDLYIKRDTNPPGAPEISRWNCGNERYADSLSKAWAFLERGRWCCQSKANCSPLIEAVSLMRKPRWRATATRPGRPSVVP